MAIPDGKYSTNSPKIVPTIVKTTIYRHARCHVLSLMPIYVSLEIPNFIEERVFIGRETVA